MSPHLVPLLWLVSFQEPTLPDLVARKPDVVRAIEYGRSRSGRPLVAYEIARRDGPLPPERRPALLVVGGLTGFHQTTVAAVEHHARVLALASDDQTVALLKACTLWLVPRANPDGLEAFASKPDREVRGNLTPVDDDRDGRVDEDPGDDLNGDGVITRMRVRDPEGEWLADDKDPRVLRRANAEKGERGVFKLYTEGKDDDGDGEYNEDGVGDVDLDRNFAQGFTEFDRNAGGFPMSQPETRALAEFVLAHPSIALAVVYGLDDTLLGEPKVDARPERVPPNGILAGDSWLYREVGESYRKLTGRKGKVADRHDGSLWSWLYCDMGIPAFACSLWTLPTEAGATAPGSQPAASQPASQPGGRLYFTVDPELLVQRGQGGGQGRGRRGGGGPPGGGPPAPSAANTGGGDDETRDERGRLGWCDAHGESARFVPWTKVTVPGLGETEVGGWRPGALVTPPAAELPGILAKHQEFVLDVLGWFARARLAETKVVAKGGDVFELTASVANEGRLPLRTATGARSGHAKQPRLTLTPGGATLLMGNTHERVDDLILGKRQKFTWLLKATPGTKVKLTLSAILAGGAEQEVELR